MKIKVDISFHVEAADIRVAGDQINRFIAPYKSMAQDERVIVKMKAK